MRIEEAIWHLREICCCEPDDYIAIDVIEAEYERVKEEVEKLEDRIDDLKYHASEMNNAHM